MKDESIIRGGLANVNTPAVMSPLVQTYGHGQEYVFIRRICCLAFQIRQERASDSDTETTASLLELDRDCRPLALGSLLAIKYFNLIALLMIRLTFGTWVLRTQPAVSPCDTTQFVPGPNR